MDEAELRGVLGEPTEVVRKKIADRLNPLTRQFVERSPFVVVATGRPDGGLDVSPRGDPAGFVRIIDERTLLIPERPGNKIADSLRNVLETGRIALLFLVPGVGETFRVIGRAQISTEPALTESFVFAGKTPRSVIVVAIERVYYQCSKAIIRSKLWDASRHVERASLPSNGTILAAITNGKEGGEEYDRAYPERVRQTIY